MEAGGPLQRAPPLVMEARMRNRGLVLVVFLSGLALFALNAAAIFVSGQPSPCSDPPARHHAPHPAAPKIQAIADG